MDIGSWRRSKHFEELWPDDKMSIWEVKTNCSKSTFDWVGVNELDYLRLADSFYHAGYSLANEIIQSGFDNQKTDSWLLADFFMLRQAIELILKSKIYQFASRKQQVQDIFVNQKHNIEQLLHSVMELGELGLGEKETDWLSQYFKDIEFWDVQSTIFRYPFQTSFYNSNPPKSVDVYETVNKLIIAYSMLRGVYADDQTYLKEIPLKLPEPRFFTEQRPGFPVCYLQDSIFSGSYYSIIEAYLSVSEFLLTEVVTIPVHEESIKFNFPAAFSMRHLLELSLKQLAVSRFSAIKSLNLRKRISTHRVYTDLWSKLFPVIIKYSGSERPDVVGSSVNEFIKEFQELDRTGDFFRYPTECNHQYHQLEQGIDLMNLYECVRAVTNLLYGCDAMFDDYAELEAEQYKECFDY